MKIKICTEKLDPWREIRAYQSETVHLSGQYGATCLFIGTMRDVNEGEAVRGMLLEHYPGMTEKELEKVVNEALQQWALLDSLLVHRVGTIYPDDAIVLVAVWSSHRGDAFDACRFIMEALKKRVPFWKRELLASGDARWVEKNTDGYLHTE